MKKTQSTLLRALPWLLLLALVNASQASAGTIFGIGGAAGAYDGLVDQLGTILQKSGAADGTAKIAAAIIYLATLGGVVTNIVAGNSPMKGLLALMGGTICSAALPMMKSDGAVTSTMVKVFNSALNKSNEAGGAKALMKQAKTHLNQITDIAGKAMIVQGIGTGMAKAAGIDAQSFTQNATSQVTNALSRPGGLPANLTPTMGFTAMAMAMDDPDGSGGLNSLDAAIASFAPILQAYNLVTLLLTIMMVGAVIIAPLSVAWAAIRGNASPVLTAVASMLGICLGALIAPAAASAAIKVGYIDPLEKLSKDMDASFKKIPFGEMIGNVADAGAHNARDGMDKVAAGGVLNTVGGTTMGVVGWFQTKFAKLMAQGSFSAQAILDPGGAIAAAKSVTRTASAAMAGLYAGMLAGLIIAIALPLEIVRAVTTMSGGVSKML